MAGETYDQYGRDGAKFGILKSEGEAIEAALGLSPISYKCKPGLPLNKRGKDFRARNVARAI
ncbi:MAG TPA: hypothetical protein PLU30_10990 [Verrucomicrobiae bacterium]|nr:hypothetical protein [Verrucomicrobiae bacterium]